MQFDDEKISGLTAALDKVEAPGDFNARVRARIASAPKTATATGFGRMLRFGLPAAALVLIGLLFWRLPDGPSGGRIGIAVERRSGEVALIAPADNPAGNGNSLVVAEQRTSPGPSNRGDLRKNGNRTSKPDAGGSIVSAVREAPAATPRTSNDPSLAPGFERTRKIRIADVLFELGIDSEPVDGRIAVRGVRANSVAERSGIVAGDVIEAINDQNVKADTNFTRSVEGRTITVIRAGKKIVTPLK